MRDTIETETKLSPQNLDPLRPGAADAEIDTEIDRKSHQIVDRLTDAYYRASANFEAYLTFRQTRGRMFGGPLPRERWIDRPASYPDSHIMHFSILAGMVLVEGLINAYFFSKSSDLGLLGGWIQAITVAFTNVIASFFLIGFLGLRLLQNPDRIFSFVAAVIGVPIIVGLVVFLNYTAAVYRDLLELNAAALALGDLATAAVQQGTVASAEDSILAPVTEALRFEGIKTLEGLLLFILGVTFATIAAFKGATFDDRLIGYGVLQRRARSSLAHLSAVLKHLPHDYVEDGRSGDSVSGPTRRAAIELKHQADAFFSADNSQALRRQAEASWEADVLDEEDNQDKPPFPGR